MKCRQGNWTYENILDYISNETRTIVPLQTRLDHWRTLHIQCPTSQAFVAWWYPWLEAATSCRVSEEHQLEQFLHCVHRQFPAIAEEILSLEQSSKKKMSLQERFDYVSQRVVFRENLNLLTGASNSSSTVDIRPTRALQSSVHQRGKCYNCGSPHHWANVCPERRQFSRPRPDQVKISQPPTYRRSYRDDNSDNRRSSRDSVTFRDLRSSSPSRPVSRGRSYSQSPTRPSSREHPRSSSSQTPPRQRPTSPRESRQTAENFRPQPRLPRQPTSPRSRETERTPVHGRVFRPRSRTPPTPTRQSRTTSQRPTPSRENPVRRLEGGEYFNVDDDVDVEEDFLE